MKRCVTWCFERVDVPDFMPAVALPRSGVEAFRFYLDLSQVDARLGQRDFGIYWAKASGQAFWTCPFEPPFFPPPLRFRCYGELEEFFVRFVEIAAMLSHAERAQLRHDLNNLLRTS